MTSTTEHSIKLLVDTQANKVLFAEAEKAVVDFLFSLLALPVGTIIKLITKESMVGSVGNIHQSLESLDYTYFLSDQAKADLLNPKVSVPSLSENGVIFLLPTSASSSSTGTNKKYYKCSYYNNINTDVTVIWGCRCPSCTKNRRKKIQIFELKSIKTKKAENKRDAICCSDYVTIVSGARCPSCTNNMTEEMQYVEPNSRETEKAENNNGENGLGVVKGLLTYTITDDLTIKPMSTISSINLLNTCNVKDLSVLQKKTVKFGINEGLQLLKASLKSKTVLTDVFLTKRVARARGSI